MSLPVKVDPCLDCQCKVENFQSNGVILHLGDRDQPEWRFTDKRTQTHTGLNVHLRIATQADVTKLLSNDYLFPPRPEAEGDGRPPLLREFTDFRGRSYPYICIALVNEVIVGKLLLDRCPINGIRKKHLPAIIDNVVVIPEQEGQGIAYELIAYAEETAIANGVKFMEIGVRRETNHPNHVRSGLDSLRLYLRRGYTEFPLFLWNELVIHYRVRDVPGIATVTNPRYGNSLIIYKDLTRQTTLTQEQVATRYARFERAFDKNV